MGIVSMKNYPMDCKDMTLSVKLLFCHPILPTKRYDKSLQWHHELVMIAQSLNDLQVMHQIWKGQLPLSCKMSLSEFSKVLCEDLIPYHKHVDCFFNYNENSSI